MEEHAASLDESLLANAYAWMRKAADDKLDGADIIGLLFSTGLIIPSILPGTDRYRSVIPAIKHGNHMSGALNMLHMCVSGHKILAQS